MSLTIERVDELVAFATTAQAGSLSAAARSLRIPVNQVSRRLARLEQRLDVLLIARTTRRMHLTAAGERLLIRAKRILQELEAAELELDTGAITGTLRLAIPTLFIGGKFLRDFLQTLHAHSALSTELLVSDAPIDPVAHGCDAAIVVGRPPDSGCRMVKLGEVSGMLAASRTYIARSSMPKEPAELAEHECLRFCGGKAQTEWPLIGPSGETEMTPIGGRFASDDSRVLLDALHAGLGIGLVMESLLGDDLVRVLPSYRFAPFEVFALYPPGAGSSARHKLALTLLQRAMTMMQYPPA